MDYVVRQGDSLWLIASRQLGNGARWQEIASLNRLADANFLAVGQVLKMPPRVPPRSTVTQGAPVTRSNGRNTPMEKRWALLPARAFFFIIADEPNPFAR